MPSPMVSLPLPLPAPAPSPSPALPSSPGSVTSPLGPAAHAVATLRIIPIHVLDFIWHFSTRGAGALLEELATGEIARASMAFRDTCSLTLADADNSELRVVDAITGSPVLFP